MEIKFVVRFYVEERMKNPCRAIIEVHLPCSEADVGLAQELKNYERFMEERLNSSWGEFDEKDRTRVKEWELGSTSWDDLKEMVETKMNEITDYLKKIVDRNRGLKETRPERFERVVIL